MGSIGANQTGQPDNVWFAGPYDGVRLRWMGIMADRKKATPAQIALAWLPVQKPWIVPIPGITKLSRLDENIGAVTAELTSEDLREIDSAASKITIQGARYPEALEKRTGL